MKIKKKTNAIRVPAVKKVIKVKRKSTDFEEEESAVSRAIKNVKKVFEKKIAETPKLISAQKIIKPRKRVVPKKKEVTSQKEVISQKKIKPRGIVCLAHIPHGFYEEEMADYFNQFGKVTRVRVARSKNTGKSRGYGYVEFLYPETAKIAADTMNNYLMCGRLLKATYIPPEKQHLRYFAGKPWTKENYPKAINRKNVTKARNASIDDTKYASFVQSTKDKLTALEKKLKEKGFDIKFTPVDGKS